MIVIILLQRCLYAVMSGCAGVLACYHYDRSCCSADTKVQIFWEICKRLVNFFFWGGSCYRVYSCYRVSLMFSDSPLQQAGTPAHPDIPQARRPRPQCFFGAAWRPHLLYCLRRRNMLLLCLLVRVVAVPLPCRCRVWLVTPSFFFLSFFEIDGLPSRNRVLIKYGYPTVQLLTR